MKKESRILISGAGIAGLTAAIWLAKEGFSPVVVEKAANPRVGGFLVALSHQAYFFAEELGLIPALRKYDLQIKCSSYHDRSGSTLLALDYDALFNGLGILQISRDDLAKVLFEQAQDVVEIRTGDGIASIAQDGGSAQVAFASGKQEDFDLVIGADGLHSAVRHQIFSPDDYLRHHLDLYVAAYKLPNVLDIKAKFETHMERSRYMAVHSTVGDDIGAVFVWSGPDARAVPPGPGRGDFLLNAYDGTTAAIDRVLQHCPRGDTFYMDALSQIDMPVWHRGRCVLVGDAAWCLTLFSGRGAAAAFAGACRLARALSAFEPAKAFEAYERAMRPVIADIMPATRKAVKWYVPRTLPNHVMRDGLMRLVPNALFRQYFKKKYSNV